MQARDRATNQIVANIMKYGATLEGVLADSVVDSDEKEFLARFRAAHGVTEAQHKAALEAGWKQARPKPAAYVGAGSGAR